MCAALIFRCNDRPVWFKITEWSLWIALHILRVSRSLSQEADYLWKEKSAKYDTSLYAEPFARNKKLRFASIDACYELEIAITCLLCLCQASPDVDEEGFSLRPGDEGDDILSAKSRCSCNSSPADLFSDTLNECSSSLSRANRLRPSHVMSCWLLVILLVLNVIWMI